MFPQIPEGSNVSDNVISGNMPDVMKQLKNFMNSVSDGKGTENADSRNKPPVLDENVRMLGNFAVMSVNESKPSTEANGKKSQERNEKRVMCQ